MPFFLFIFNLKSRMKNRGRTILHSALYLIRCFAYTGFLIFKKAFQRLKYVRFLFQDVVFKFIIFDIFIGGHESGMPVILIDLTVTEQIRFFHDVIDELYAPGVIRSQVIPV